MYAVKHIVGKPVALLVVGSVVSADGSKRLKVKEALLMLKFTEPPPNKVISHDDRHKKG